jgi:ABC-type multidrug transport system fused ATPase/permease subunit
MDGSRIAETGTHEQLLARGGAYTALVRAQSSGGGQPDIMLREASV